MKAKIITADEHEMSNHDVILYAVWEVVNNSNGNLDYAGDTDHVWYHGNNNDFSDVRCHHHVVGAEIDLSTTAKNIGGKWINHNDSGSTEGTIGNLIFTYGTTIFLGWSTTPILNKIVVTSDDYAALKNSIKTKITMLDKPSNGVSDIDAADTGKYADTDGNTNVYAVWTQDYNQKRKSGLSERTFSDIQQ